MSSSTRWRKVGIRVNAEDILKYGQRTLLGSIEGFPASEWETPGVCGVWSTKDVLAHLASHEQVLTDVLAGFAGANGSGALDLYMSQGPEFNDFQVAERRDKTPGEVLDELNSAHTRNMSLVSKIGTETLRQAGTLPWYGMEYALDDLIVYGFYGHKREHSAQIAVFLDRLKQGAQAA